MSRYHEVAARVRADATFASYLRANPAEVGVAYGLSDDELSRLTGLSDAGRDGAADRPAAGTDQAP